MLNNLAYRTGQAFYEGRLHQNDWLIQELIDNKVIRRDALGSLVFVNCDTMRVEYLPDNLIKGENK